MRLFKSQIATIALTGVSLALTAALQTGCSGNKTKPTESPAPSDGGKGIPLVGTFQVQTFTLDNGLRLLVVEDHTSPTLAYQTWFRVGSRDEAINHTGLAHLFEHMMFKGTETHAEGQYMKIVERVGAEGLNAFTSHDYTAYVQSVPSNQLDLVAGLESDRMVHLVVNDESFRSEIGVVQNERLFRDENNPEGTIENEMYGLAFKKHPYHWPVVGYQEDLNRMSPENARDFYKAHYNPAHATIIIVGDVKADQALSTIKKYYGGIPGMASPPNAIEPEPEQKEPRRKNISLNIQVDKVWMAYKVPSLTAPDSPALEVLASVLTGGKSSRLYRTLVDTGLAGSVDANNPGNKDAGLFTISVNLQKGKKATQAEAVVNQELQRLQREPISERELDRAKNRLSFDFYSGLSSSGEKARFMGYFEATAGSFEKGVEFRKKVLEVTPEQLQNLMKTYFTPNNRTVITALPKAAPVAPNAKKGKGKSS